VKKTFIEKPPRFHAIQFDGSLASGTEITLQAIEMELDAMYYPGISWEQAEALRPGNHNVPPDGRQPRVEIRNPRQSRPHGIDVPMYEGDWFVWSDDSREFQIITDFYFAAHFTEVES
jgi:hypothetical protein